MRRSSLIAAAIVAGSAAPALAADPAPVVAAERAFAAKVAEVGVRDGFLAFMAEDAIVFTPEPVKAKAFYAARPPSKPARDGGVRLTWRPDFAGLAKSQDLGFSSGPAEVNGAPSSRYVTIWKRQADGAWKWQFDGGVDDTSPRPAQPPAVRVLAEGAPGDPATALAEVKAADAARRRDGLGFEPLGGGASAAGDLAWTYGMATAGTVKSPYLRIWRREPAGWAIVLDQTF